MYYYSYEQFFVFVYHDLSCLSVIGDVFKLIFIKWNSFTVFITVYYRLYNKKRKEKAKTYRVYAFFAIFLFY